MEVFDRDPRIWCNVTALDTFELDPKIGRSERFANFYVDCSSYRAPSNVATYVVVEIDVDSAIHVHI